MEISLSNKLFEEFEAIKLTQDDIEFRSARDLQKILGYIQWRNFEEVIEKAKNSCKSNKIIISDHFADVSKSIVSGKWADFEISDMMLSRYACYLIAQNGDPRKTEIAFAQSYFAVQTRKMEIVQKRLADFERIQARQKQTLTEKEFQKIAFERWVDGKWIARIISKWDKVLFGGNSTGEMKQKLAVPGDRSLSDFLPTVTIKAKDLATEMTNHNTIHKNLQWENPITNEHVSNNKEVREMLKKRGITPENLPAAEDVKKVQRKLNNDWVIQLSRKKK
jgi:DNA-damage-inducible protein D